MRTRVAWLVTLCGVLLSMQIPFTQAAWHGFDRPNGGAFRETFVVTGLLVMMAWIAVARDPGRGARLAQAGVGLLGLAGVVGIAAVTGTGREELHPATIPVALTVGVVAAALFFVLRPRWPRAAAAALLVLVAAELLATAVAIDEQRDGFHRYDTWTAADSREARTAGAAARDAWPTHRVSLGEDVRANGPALYGVAGMSYYSSSMPRLTAEVVTNLGLGWTSFGRGMAGTTDPGATPLLAIAETVDVPEAGSLPPAFPMIRSIPVAADLYESPFNTRNALYGVDVYEPQVTGDSHEPLAITCPDRAVLQGWAPDGDGRWLVDGVVVADQSSVLSEGSQETRPGIQTLGEFDGEVAVEFASDLPHDLTLSCLRMDVLEAAVAEAPAPSELEISGSRISATWSEPPGEVVLATPFADEWRCGDLTTRRVAGLLTVQLADSSSLACRFVPQGLVQGAGLSLLALLLLAGRVVARTLSRRGSAARSAGVMPGR